VRHPRALILLASSSSKQEHSKLSRSEIARSIVFTDLDSSDVSERALLLLVVSWCRRTYKPPHRRSDSTPPIVHRAILKNSGGVVVVLSTRAAAIALSSARFPLSRSGRATLASDLLCSSTAYASAVSKARSTTYSSVPKALTKLIAAALDRARREKSVRESAERGRHLLISLMKPIITGVVSSTSPPAIHPAGRFREVFDRASGVFAGIGDGLYSRVAEELVCYEEEEEEEEEEVGDYV